MRDDGLEEIRPHVDDGAHQQAACRSALDHEPVGGRVLVLHEIVRDVDEVGKGVHLLHHAPGFAPLFAQLSATADAGEREDESTIKQRDARGRKRGVDRRAVGSVRVQQHRRAAVHRCSLLVHDRDGNPRAVTRCRPEALRFVA